MSKGSTAAILAGLAALAAVTVHYVERSLLPFVERVRTTLYGEQTYSSALQGCSSLGGSRSWVHPTTLALTVYGDTQRILISAFGPHGTEVLPDDAAVFAGEHELLCVADAFLATTTVKEIDGAPVRRIIFDIPQSTYQLASGWVSGLAQGMAGQVVLAAYVATHDDKYLRAARELRNLFLVPVEKGGVRVDLAPGSVWYEEYAQAGIRPWDPLESTCRHASLSIL